MKYIYVLILLSLFTSLNEAYSIELCDSARACIGRSLAFTQTTGKTPHYVDVVKTPSLANIDTAMTVEMWFKPKRQPGKTQFIGGLWGPAEDKNDVWVAYINANDSLFFELNGFKQQRGIDDNTRTAILATPLYDKWSHIAFVFNGKDGSASIFINGVLQSTNINLPYRLSRLNTLENDELSVQFGSSNALLNNTIDYCTFSGEMDEVRVWSRTLSSPELICGKDLSLAGNEKNLVLYYRMNQLPHIYYLCDATPNGNFGWARNGAATVWSNRVTEKKYLYSPDKIVDTLYCQTTKSYDFTFRDSSICGTRLSIRIMDNVNRNNYSMIVDGKTYKWNEWAYVNLTPGVSSNLTLTINATFTGTTNSVLEVRNQNNCNWNIANIPISITRLSELSYSRESIKYDSLTANCIQRLYIDSTIQICNNTDKSGTPSPIRIDSISNRFKGVYSLVGASFPLTLSPGECRTFTVRFKSGDTTALYQDTLYVYSTDKCEAVKKIPLSGKVNEALKIMTNQGTRLDSINFGTVCVGFASDAIEYLWENKLGYQVTVDDIIVPEHFLSKNFKFKVGLDPATSYRPNYFRFVPTAAGHFRDTVVFVVTAGGCTVHKKILVKGYGFFADVAFEADTVDFGDVFVGQEKTLDITVRNKSDEALNISSYLKAGYGFFLNSAKGMNIAPGQVKSFKVTFKPTSDSVYFDSFCLFEQRCYRSDCMTVRGRGVIERFTFAPEILEIKDVIGCESKRGNLVIKNNTSTAQTLSNITLDDPSGKLRVTNPFPIPSTITIGANSSTNLEFEYSPNDLNFDRADKAYFRYETSDGEEWAAVVIGKSVVPKLFITPLVEFETIEVGDTRLDTIYVENVSAMNIKVDSIAIGAGYEIVSPNPFSARSLKPKEEIRVIIRFKPDKEGSFDSRFTVFASSPCTAQPQSEITGLAIIVPLEMPISVLSYGFVRPCDCLEREIPLINRSSAFEMIIDSVWIAPTADASSTPWLFTWKSSNFAAQGSTLPYSIPKLDRDTLRVVYCPRSPSDWNYIDNSSILNIKAHGNGWDAQYESFLSGKRALLYAADTTRILFPPTPVDTFSMAKKTNLYIPPIEANPSRANAVIESITFEPDERVFYYDTNPSGSLPYTIDSINGLQLSLTFKPRAVRPYEAKMHIKFSEPCNDLDTTIFLSGIGFAPAFGLSFNFDSKSARDTFKIISCDTLRIPVYSSRKIPADLVDISYRLLYDTTKLNYLGAESVYYSENCPPYTASSSMIETNFGGRLVSHKNFCNVDSLRPFAHLVFVPLQSRRDTLFIQIDSIKFDTEEVIYYHLIADGDDAVAILLEPEFRIENALDFGTVQVLDCRRDTIRVTNIGDVPLSFNEVLGETSEMKVITTIPALDSTIPIGSVVDFVVEYCPRTKDSSFATLSLKSTDPCLLLDSVRTAGLGYAPLYEFYSDVSMNVSIPDTLSAFIGDTISIPISFDKDLGMEINGTKYWLEGLKFTANFEYNPYTMKYLFTENLLPSSNLTINEFTGLVELNFADADSIAAGNIAMLRFLVAVPDTTTTFINVSSGGYATDSLMFLDLSPISCAAFFTCKGRCNLTTLKFSNSLLGIVQNYPNPADKSTTIKFSLEERSSPILTIFSIDGRKTDILLDGRSELLPGEYQIVYPTHNLETGIYFYSLRVGDKELTRIMNVLR